MNYSTQIMREVVNAHQLIRNEGLAKWSSGNASFCSRRDQAVYIKPSGVMPQDMVERNIVVVDMKGDVKSGALKPSTDTEAHLYVYNQLEHINAIVHTHSPYATAFAIHGWEIPCIMTAMADEFGGDIPCGDYAEIGNDAIGKELVRMLKNCPHCPAVLMKQHGVFTVGKDLDAALKAAVMVEEIAKTAYLAIQLDPNVVSLPEGEVNKNYQRYHTTYGQTPR